MRRSPEERWRAGAQARRERAKLLTRLERQEAEEAIARLDELARAEAAPQRAGRGRALSWAEVQQRMPLFDPVVYLDGERYDLERLADAGRVLESFAPDGRPQIIIMEPARVRFGSTSSIGIR